MYTTAGRPDLSGCYHGRRFEIEVKRPGGTLTDLQFMELVAWKQAGAICGVVTSEQEALDVLRSNSSTYSDNLDNIVIMVCRGIILPQKALILRVQWDYFTA
jgi:hypothetical protein